MTITYGGIPLCAISLDQQATVERKITLRDVIEFSNVTWPQTWLDRPPQLGRLHWPVGASTWATGHFLATDAQLTQIRRLAYNASAPGKYVPLPLVMDDGNSRPLTTNLFMLPPRPLSQAVTVPGLRELYLLTLVDARYYWRGAAVNIGITGGTTTWSQLFAAIATALGTPITTDVIAPAYMKPAESLTSRYGSVPELLDRACDSIGHRLVRNLDGTIVTQAARTAIAGYTRQYARAWQRLAGGKFKLYVTDLPNDFPTVPGTVLVVFPRSDSGVPSGEPYTIPVTLQSLKLPEYPGSVTGSGAAKIVWTTADADFAGGGTPTNNAELLALANQLATDYYLWLLARLDVVWSGNVPWQPEGFHEVLWDCREQGVTTRVLAAPRRDADPNPFGAPSNIANYYSTYGSGPLIIENSFIFNQQVTVNNVLNFPAVSNQANTPRGQMSYPTCTAPGPPTWIPKPGYYPTVWVSSTNTLYFWNGTAWVAIGGGGGGGGGSGGKSWEHYRHRTAAPFAAQNKTVWQVAGVHGRDVPLVPDETATVNIIHATPMIFPGGGKIDRLGYTLGTSSGSKVVFGIYKATSAVNNWPGVKVYNSPPLDLAGAAGLSMLNYLSGVNFTPDPNTLYWFTVLFDTNTTGYGIADGVSAWQDLFAYLLDELPSPIVPPNVNDGVDFIRADFTYDPILPDPFPAFDNSGVRFFPTGVVVPAIFFHMTEGGAGGGGAGGGTAAPPDLAQLIFNYNQFVAAVAANQFIVPDDFQVPT